MNATEDGEIRRLDGVSPRRWFGMHSYAVDGKMFATWWNGLLVLKLPPEAHAQAMALPDASPFDPTRGRPMREWVVLPQAESATLSRLIGASHAYVRNL